MKTMIQKAILILLVCLMPIPVSAYDFKVGKVFYRIIDYLLLQEQVAL